MSKKHVKPVILNNQKPRDAAPYAGNNHAQSAPHSKTASPPKIAAIEKNYWLHVLSPLHIGAGRGVGYIDLPITREKVTNWPYIPGSAIKGVIADKFGATEEQRAPGSKLAAAFGLASDNGDSQAGSLVFSDASIVCLPVRSFYGTFAWITSPMALKRLRCPGKPAVSDRVPTAEEIFIPKDNNQGSSKIVQDSKVYLEDIDLSALDVEKITPWRDFLANNVFPGNDNEDDSWRDIFKQRFALVSDDVFTFFCENGTEVNPRIRIDDKTKTVAEGALWYEESLPVETILSGVVWCDRVYGDRGGESTPRTLMDEYCKTYDLQIGGKASIGKGLVRCVFSGSEQ